MATNKPYWKSSMRASDSTVESRSEMDGLQLDRPTRRVICLNAHLLDRICTATVPWAIDTLTRLPPSLQTPQPPTSLRRQRLLMSRGTACRSPLQMRAIRPVVNIPSLTCIRTWHSRISFTRTVSGSTLQLWRCRPWKGARRTDTRSKRCPPAGSKGEIT